MIKNLIKTIFIAYILILSISCAVNRTLSEKTLEFVILHTNDHHGRFFSWQFTTADSIVANAPGLAERAYIIKQLISSNENYLILDAGDFTSGLFQSKIFDYEPDIVGMNMIGYHAAAMGNHEFDRGLSWVEKFNEWANFPMLSANTFDLNGEYIVKPYIIKTLQNGLNVAIYGLTTTMYNLGADVILKCYVETSKELVPKLRDKADVVIALTHLGIMQNPDRESSFFPGRTGLKVGSQRLADEVEGIDLIIDGHSHIFIQEPFIVNNTPIVIAADWGTVLGKAVMEYDLATKRVRLKEWEAIRLTRKVNDPQLGVDEDIQAVINDYLIRAANDIRNSVVGYNSKDFDIPVSYQQSELGKFFADAMFHTGSKYNADLALFNFSSLGYGHTLSSGDVSLMDLHKLILHNNRLLLAEITGQALWEIVQKSQNEKINTGGFLLYSSNVLIKEKSTNEWDILINNEKIDLNKIYKIVVSSFLIRGGHGYQQFTSSSNVIDIGKSKLDSMIEFLEEK